MIMFSQFLTKTLPDKKCSIEPVSTIQQIGAQRPVTLAYNNFANIQATESPATRAQNRWPILVFAISSSSVESLHLSNRFVEDGNHLIETCSTHSFFFIDLCSVLFENS